MEKNFALMCGEDYQISVNFSLNYFDGINSQDIYKSCLETIYKEFVGNNNDKLDNNGLYKIDNKPIVDGILNPDYTGPFTKMTDINDCRDYYIEVIGDIDDYHGYWINPLHFFVHLYKCNTNEDKLILDMIDIYLNDFPNNFDIKNTDNHTCLSYILRSISDYKPNRMVKLLRFLLERGSNLDLCNTTKFNGILNLLTSDIDCFEDLYYCINFILKSGFDINSTDVNGNTVLHRYCITRQNPTLVKYLLDNHADVNIKNNKGNNVLHILIQHNRTFKLVATGKFFTPHLCLCDTDINIETLKLIIGKITNINDTNNDGESPIDILCNYDNDFHGEYKECDEFGPYDEYGKYDGKTKYVDEIVQILLENGSNPHKIKLISLVSKLQNYMYIIFNFLVFLIIVLIMSYWPQIVCR